MSQTSLPSVQSEIVQQVLNIGLNTDQMIFTLCQISELGLTYRKNKVYENILIILIRVSKNEKDLLKNLASIGFDVNCCCITYTRGNLDITIPIRNHDGKVIAVHGVGKFASL